MLFPVILKFFHSLCLWFFFFLCIRNCGKFVINASLRLIQNRSLPALLPPPCPSLPQQSTFLRLATASIYIHSLFFSSALSSYSGHVKVLSIGGGSTGHISHPSCQYCPQRQSLTIADVCFRPIDICWQSALLQSILLFGKFLAFDKDWVYDLSKKLISQSCYITYL